MKSHFGKYGGRYVPEMLIPALEQMDQTYEFAKKDKKFHKEFSDLLNNFAGRPTPFVFTKI
jgi:tryptophan synthase beta chain